MDILTGFVEWVRLADTDILSAVQSIGPTFYVVAWVLSGIVGSLKVLAPAFVIVLFLINKKRVALEVLVIFTVSLLLSLGLKYLIESPRPFMIDSSVIVYEKETGFGMPSAHAVISVVVLGWVWLRHPRSWMLSIGAGVLILLIGLSRVYLGVHYPSQVIAGWVLGLLLLWLFSYIDRWYFRPRGMYVRKEGAR
jgi:membrane-associated phospholipid phosphatase